MKRGRSPRLRRALPTALLALLSSCAGTGSGEAPDDLEEVPAPSFSCDPAGTGAPERLRRLTMTQYRNTVRDLVTWALGNTPEAEAVLARAALDELPRDRREPLPQDQHGTYRRLDQALEQIHVDAAYRVGTTLGAALTEPGHLATVVGSCAVDDAIDNDAECVTNFILRFGGRALRHPIDAEELGFYWSVYGTNPTASPEAYADVISVMLNAPHFLYFVEHGSDASAGKPGVYELSPHEVATRLSYHFWQTLPDAELWEAAENGSLRDPQIYEHQVHRMTEDPRTRETVREFFADWLKVEELPRLDENNDDALYASFTGADLPGPDLRQHMIDEVLDMVLHYTWVEPGGLTELLTSDASFARTPELARIYGLSPWDGVSPPPRFSPGERPGLFTRALFLATGSANTRPIRNGVFLRRYVLCDDISPPPGNANAVLPELRPDMTTRQVVEGLTEQPGTVCASCHATLINPLGFAFEGFDALGRARTEQRLFDGMGNLLGALPVDTESVPRVTPGDRTVSSGPADLMQLMLDSGKLEACLARNYYRFTFGRWEDPASDGCVLERLRARLVTTGRLVAMLKEVALTPEFRQRSFGNGHG